MKSLQIQNIYFKYPSSANYIFQDLSLEFYRGWSGLVGANGAGKTTLLKLIIKDLTPESGTIKNDLLTTYCPQSTENIPKNAEEFFSVYDGKTFKLKDLLGIEEEWLYRWESLSHGEKKRVQIATALFQEPDLLIVDEPTNHLDTQTKKRVFNALLKFQGVGILVSHDRELLDLLCGETIVIKNSQITKIKSNFSVANRELQTIKEFQKEKKEKQEQKVKNLERQIETNKDKVSKAEKRLSKKAIGKNDSDSKAKINLAKLTGKDKNDGQAVKNAMNKKEQILKEKITIEKEYEKGIFFQNQIDERAFPFTIEKTDFIINNFSLHIPKLVIEKKDKIWIQGENGSGKSTFINYLISTLTKEYLYIPQEISEKESMEIFKEIRELPKEKQGEIFTLITRLSSDPKALIKSKNPSPGEIRKLLIAKDLAKNPPLIILDEPTNHMDLDSIIAIEKALKEFQGAVIFISHDKAFCENLSNKIWKVKREGKEIYLCD